MARVLLLLLLIPFLCANQNDIVELDVHQVLLLAERKNRDLAVSRARLSIAEARLNKAEKSFGVRVDGIVSTFKEDMPSFYLGKTVDQRTLQLAGTDLNHPGVNDHAQVGVEVSYPLYSGGLKKLTKIYADLEQKSVVFDHDSARNQLGSAGVELWYQFLIAKERFQTETKSLRRVEKHLEDIQVRYSGGSVLKTDLLSVKVRVEETRLALVSAENTLEVARTTLLAFLGLAFDTKIRVKESEFSYPKMPEPLHAAIEYAMQHRPEIKREQINADIAKKSMQIAGAGKKWNIGLMGQYNFNDEDLGFSQGEENWMLGVRFQKNLFDTGLTDARKSEAKAALELQSRKIEKTYIDIKLDVKNCYEDLIHAREAVRVAGTNLELAEENLSLMKQQYQGGSVTVTALLDADQAYSNALLNEVSSRYRAKMAKARFGRAIGFCLSCLNENISLSEDKGGLK